MLRTTALAVLFLAAGAYGNGKQPGERQRAILKQTETVMIEADRSAEPSRPAMALLAAGCFWGVELAFARLPGVLATEVGYAGGKTTNPTYRDVTRGDTGHAEAVRVTYNPAVLSLKDLLDVFFDVHDPTTLNRQGNDVGTQYRSAIFVSSVEERTIAEQAISREQQRLVRPLSTTIEWSMSSTFTPAEDYHRACENLEAHSSTHALHVPPLILFRCGSWADVDCKPYGSRASADLD